MKFAGLACGLFTIAWLAAAQSAPAQHRAPKRLQISGLQDSVEILKDRWGISHIYAKNEADLFFAQGYNIAWNRLWPARALAQAGHRHNGGILGRKALGRDIGNRLFLYRGDRTQELSWLIFVAVLRRPKSCATSSGHGRKS